MWFSIAYSRQGALTGQSAQIRRASSTPTPSLGKKVSGGKSRHLPSAIHELSITTSIDLVPRRSQPGTEFPSRRRTGQKNRSLACVERPLLRPEEPDRTSRRTSRSDEHNTRRAPERKVEEAALLDSRGRRQGSCERDHPDRPPSSHVGEHHNPVLAEPPV